MVEWLVYAVAPSRLSTMELTPTLELAVALKRTGLLTD